MPIADAIITHIVDDDANNADTIQDDAHVAPIIKKLVLDAPILDDDATVAAVNRMIQLMHLSSNDKCTQTNTCATQMI